MSALLDTREELFASKEHARELEALTREREDERRSPPQYGSGAVETTPPSGPVTSPGIADVPQVETVLPPLRQPLAEIIWPVGPLLPPIVNRVNWLQGNNVSTPYR